MGSLRAQRRSDHPGLRKGPMRMLRLAEFVSAVQSESGIDRATLLDQPQSLALSTFG